MYVIVVRVVAHFGVHALGSHPRPQGRDVRVTRRALCLRVGSRAPNPRCSCALAPALGAVQEIEMDGTTQVKNEDGQTGPATDEWCACDGDRKRGGDRSGAL